MNAFTQLRGIAVRTASGLRQRVRRRNHPKHPIDLELGIETSRQVSVSGLATGAEIERYSIAYLGAQPSIIRASLDLIPIDEDMTFIDLGCGKGRPLVVAADYPFRRLIGVELSPYVAQVARRNVAGLRPAEKYGKRIFVIIGDASIPNLGKESTVLFLYNPFRRPIVERLVAHLSSERKGKLWIVYYNPVCFDVFDASPVFKRYYAGLHHFSEGEKRAVRSHSYDSVIIYQSLDNPMLEPKPGAGAAVKITIPDLGADVQS